MKNNIQKAGAPYFNFKTLPHNNFLISFQVIAHYLSSTLYGQKIDPITGVNIFNNGGDQIVAYVGISQNNISFDWVLNGTQKSDGTMSYDDSNIEVINYKYGVMEQLLSELFEYIRYNHPEHANKFIVMVGRIYNIDVLKKYDNLASNNPPTYNKTSISGPPGQPNFNAKKDKFKFKIKTISDSEFPKCYIIDILVGVKKISSYLNYTRKKDDIGKIVAHLTLDPKRLVLNWELVVIFDKNGMVNQDSANAYHSYIRLNTNRIIKKAYKFIKATEPKFSNDFKSGAKKQYDIDL